jgi:hypothetical protein
VPARRANVTNAAIELAFVVVAGVLGAFHAPWWTLFILADLMIVYWMWNRRVGIKQLEAMGAAKLAAAAALSLALIAAVLTGAYWIGRYLSGVIA